MNKIDYYTILSQNTIFKFASYESLRAAIPQGALSVLAFTQDEEICSPQTSEARVGIVISGSALVCPADESKKVVLREIKKNASFGFSNLYTDSPFPTRIFAKRSCEILFVRADAVKALIESDSAVLRAFLTLLSTKIEYLNKRIASFTAGSAERRLSLYLSENEKDGTCSLSLSMSALADTLDIGRASLYRAFERLCADGFIKRHGKDVSIVDKKSMLEKYLH